jgi:hypothetical protein
VDLIGQNAKYIRLEEKLVNIAMGAMSDIITNNEFVIFIYRIMMLRRVRELIFFPHV